MAIAVSLAAKPTAVAISRTGVGRQRRRPALSRHRARFQPGSAWRRWISAARKHDCGADLISVNLCLKSIADGTVIWTSPSGDTYVTTPGSALLFPSLCTPTGELTVPDVVVDDRCGEWTAMMPRRRTRAQKPGTPHRRRTPTKPARPRSRTTTGGRVLRELPPRRRRRPAAFLSKGYSAL